MIGIFDYTVILTYISLLSGVMGIIVCLNGIGHPFIGMFFLMLSGLCDTFDGRVARTKKDRTERAINFGIQIDSLSDLVAFGVLPPCIGVAMLRVSPRFTEVPEIHLIERSQDQIIYPIFLMAIALFYVLAALIRLAYFNVLEIERQGMTDPGPRYYTGLPVTSAALIFPTVLLIQFASKADLTLLFFGALALTGILFISKIHIRKPQMKAIAILLVIGAIEFVLLIVTRLLRGG